MREETHQPPHEQLPLAGIKSRTPHANRGKALEAMLDRTHERYKHERRAVIYHVPNAFTYCPERAYQRLDPYLKARLGTGLTMVRVKTPCDYIGGAKGFPLAFDAKEFHGASIPLDDFTPHQVEGLLGFERVGLAGFMVYARRAGQVFWVRAGQVREAQDKVAFQKGRGAHPKSFNLAWLEENAVLVCRTHDGGEVDWLPVLTGAVSSRSSVDSRRLPAGGNQPSAMRELISARRLAER